MPESAAEHIVCDPGLCTGCKLCEFACSLAKAGRFDLSVSRIHVARPDPTLSAAVACQLCADAPCIAVCPRKALVRDDDTSPIKVIANLCTGCGWCVEVCDYGAVSLDRTSKCVVICDLCLDRDTPACVATCPKRALSRASGPVLQSHDTSGAAQRASGRDPEPVGRG